MSNLLEYANEMWMYGSKGRHPWRSLHSFEKIVEGIWFASSFANMTADIPMIDPLLIDNAINVYQNIKPDLLLFEKYSFGVCLMVKVSALSKVCKEKKNNYTEAWVKFFQNNKNVNIHIENVSKENKNKFLKTSLDYYEDFLFIKRKMLSC